MDWALDWCGSMKKASRTEAHMFVLVPLVGVT